MADGDCAVTEATAPDSMARCLEIRRRVFIEEQGVPAEIEVDGEDPLCRHYLAWLDGQALGAARMKPIAGAAKLQRIAVMPEARGAGLGIALVRRMIADARAALSDQAVILSSQSSAIGFYEKLGFVAEGDEFMDAGIPHRNMRYGG